MGRDRENNLHLYSTRVDVATAPQVPFCITCQNFAKKCNKNHIHMSEENSYFIQVKPFNVGLLHFVAQFIRNMNVTLQFQK